VGIAGVVVPLSALRSMEALCSHNLFVDQVEAVQRCLTWLVEATDKHLVVG